MACNFENEGLLKVTGSHVHCKNGNVISPKRYEMESLLQTHDSPINMKSGSEKQSVQSCVRNIL